MVVYQQEDIDGKRIVRVPPNPVLKGWWKCLECGNFCGYLNHSFKTEIKRHNCFCSQCDKPTDQVTVKFEGR